MRRASIVNISKMEDDIDAVLNNHISEQLNRILQPSAKIPDDSDLAFRGNGPNPKIVNLLVVNVVNSALAL